MITPYPHQVELADEVMVVLRQYGVAYLASEERTGKTLAAILAAESSLAKRVLVITKKKALYFVVQAARTSMQLTESWQPLVAVFFSQQLVS